MKKVSKANIGRIAVTRELLAEASAENLITMFKDIFVLQIATSPDIPNAKIYVGISPMFKEIDVGENIPLYILHIQQDQLKTKTKITVKNAEELEDDGDDNWTFIG